MNNKEYWNRRFLIDKAGNVNAGEKFLKNNIEELYRKALKEVQEDIEKFYQSFADKNHITLSEAKRKIKASEFKNIDFDELISLQVTRNKELKEKMKELPGDIVATLEKKAMEYESMLQAYTRKGQITHLELLQVEMEKVLLDLYDKQQINIYELLADQYTDSYYRNDKLTLYEYIPYSCSATDMFVYKNELYVLGDNVMHKFNGKTWEEFITPVSRGSYLALTIYNDILYYHTSTDKLKVNTFDFKNQTWGSQGFPTTNEKCHLITFNNNMYYMSDISSLTCKYNNGTWENITSKGNGSIIAIVEFQSRLHIITTSTHKIFDGETYEIMKDTDDIIDKNLFSIEDLPFEHNNEIYFNFNIRYNGKWIIKHTVPLAYISKDYVYYDWFTYNNHLYLGHFYNCYWQFDKETDSWICQGDFIIKNNFKGVEFREKTYLISQYQIATYDGEVLQYALEKYPNNDRMFYMDTIKDEKMYFYDIDGNFYEYDGETFKEAGTLPKYYSYLKYGVVCKGEFHYFTYDGSNEYKPKYAYHYKLNGNKWELINSTLEYNTDCTLTLFDDKICRIKKTSNVISIQYLDGLNWTDKILVFEAFKKKSSGYYDIYYSRINNTEGNYIVIRSTLPPDQFNREKSIFYICTSFENGFTIEPDYIIQGSYYTKVDNEIIMTYSSYYYKIKLTSRYAINKK